MVVQLMLRMGYGGGEESGFVTPRSGDEGVDGWIQEDKLGFSYAIRHFFDCIRNDTVPLTNPADAYKTGEKMG